MVATARHPPRALLVGRTEAGLSAFREVFTPLGCAVELTLGAEAATRRIQQQRYEILVVDVTLDDGHGIELVAALMEQGLLRTSQIVFVTDDAPDDVLLSRACALGCVDVLSRPISRELVRAKLRVVVELSTTERLLLEASDRLNASGRANRVSSAMTPSEGTPSPTPPSSVSDAALAAADQAVELLKLSEERYRLAARASNDVLWDWDLASAELHWSETLATVFGHELPAQRGFCTTTIDWWMDQVHPDDKAQVEKSLSEALRSQEDSWTHEYRFRLGNGEWAQVLDRGCVVRDAHGVAVRMVGALNDITEQTVRTNFQHQLVGIVSHDLRNPIAAISLGATVMLQRGDLSAAQTESAQQIVRASDRASRMVRDLLDFTRARLGGGIPILPRPANLKLVCDPVLREVLTAHPGRDVRVNTTGSLDGVWDSDRLGQVLQNLVANALAYGPRDAAVTVTLDGTGEQLALHVHNHGEPIPEALLPRIFEPLTRGAPDGSSRSIGLGLYIVQNIVRAHGGRIDVESSAEAGTTFTVRLPRRPAPSAGRSSGVFSLRALKAAQDARARPAK